MPATPTADSLATLFAADLSKMPAPRAIRNEGQKARTTAIRALFRTLGIKNVSVTAARGSGCYWTQIRIDFDFACLADHYDPSDHWAGVRAQEACPTCRRRAAAVRRVHYLVATAFPDLDDRSDSQSDHFDFMYTLN